ncbi:hypothetical protein BDV96DRAFT_640415 [Lophiotrema nucula]|uniref:F-box domain-containing protein n=1 Tax=Lophiotrema nucula TaxID=690887 RepID=A0A6A5ZU15_9PLEO|nr:hypothetical protein BDV96DRAFT_640415 [Lophiotrema nucula]
MSIPPILFNPGMPFYSLGPALDTQARRPHEIDYESLFRHLKAWMYRQLWPPEVIRRRHDRIVSELREIENSANSYIHKLPSELIFQVAEYLPAADLLTSRYSCRWLAKLLNAKVLYVEKPDQVQKEVAWRVNLDRYDEQGVRDKDSDNTARLSSVPCGFCKTAHPECAFNTEEILKSPRERRCDGARGKFRACTHRSFDWENLHEMLNTAGSFTCSTNPCRLYVLDAPFVSRDRYTIYSFSTLFRHDIPGREAITWSQLQNWCTERAAYICPHWNTADKSFQDRLLRESNIFTSPNMDKRVRFNCLKEDCETTLEIDRFVSVHGGLITGRIWRYLRYPKSPRDPKWLAQIEY